VAWEEEEEEVEGEAEWVASDWDPVENADAQIVAI